MTQNEAMRVAFEKHCNNEGLTVTRQWEDANLYTHYSTMVAWSAWQEAYTTLPRVSEEELVRLLLNAAVEEYAYGSSCNVSEAEANRIAAALFAKFPFLERK
jgi:hypothetical protein